VSRDPQQSRVYAWEGQWKDWNRRTITLKAARSLARMACEEYGLKPPRLTTHAGKAYSYSQGDLVSFEEGQVNRAIVLHECAHYITGAIFGDAIAHHSPEWMGCYLWLLVRFHIAPRIALEASAKAKRITWMPLGTMSPKRLKRRKRK
jgi:hypothetical protein